jgi:hypothetical protein
MRTARLTRLMRKSKLTFTCKHGDFASGNCNTVEIERDPAEQTVDIYKAVLNTIFPVDPARLFFQNITY